MGHREAPCLPMDVLLLLTDFMDAETIAKFSMVRTWRQGFMAPHVHTTATVLIGLEGSALSDQSLSGCLVTTAPGTDRHRSPSTAIIAFGHYDYRGDKAVRDSPSSL